MKTPDLGASVVPSIFLIIVNALPLEAFNAEPGCLNIFNSHFRTQRYSYLKGRSLGSSEVSEAPKLLNSAIL
jgi:hypothetical protein